MEKLIQFLDMLTPYGSHSYFVMFGVLLACGFGFPMPEDVVLISGGVLSARGVCDLYVTNIVCFLGVMIGDGTVFTIGRVMGHRVRNTWLFSRILTPERNVKVEQTFAKHGDKVIFVARFLPGLRTPLFLTAGIYQVPYWKFVAFDGFAALISVPVWIYVGYLFGDNLELLGEKLGQIQAGFIPVIVFILVAFLVIYKFRRKSA